MKSFKEILDAAGKTGRCRIAVAQAADVIVLDAVETAREKGLIEPVLVGEEDAIKEAAESINLDLKSYEIVPASPTEAARTTVKLITGGRADILMKGHISTGALLKEVLNKENGLNIGKALSQVGIFEHPDFDRLLFVTDAGLNIAPDFKNKIDIIQNAINLARSLGIKNPIAAVLCAVEYVNPAMPATLEAAGLSKLAERGGIKGGRVEGPLALDNAVSVKAAKRKGIDSPLAGKADILVAPDIEAGNILYKSMVFFAGMEPASIVVGARVPVVLASRSDSATTRLYSIALGVLSLRNIYS